MKPLFTIHAGEYLVASYIEETIKGVNVWIPTRDTGVDLLVSDSSARKTVSLQVKFSKDFLYMMQAKYQGKDSLLSACGWWKIDREKLKKSKADFWVMMLFGLNGSTKDFLIIPPKDLLERMELLDGSAKTFQTYLWVTRKHGGTGAKCWTTRDLSPEQKSQVARGEYNDKSHDMSEWLNNWTPITEMQS
jgi:hypothetical protein